MAVNPLEQAVEVFSAPIEGVIVALGKGISEAQAALDRNSIATQSAIDADPQLSSAGLQATWYQFPRVDLQLKLALTIAEQQGVAARPVPAALDVVAARPLRLVAQPVSAAYQNHFNYAADAASTITLSIVPVPPPRSGDQTTAPPRMTPDQVRAAALSSRAKFTTARDSSGAVVPAASLRFDINFNAVSRSWYVLQYDAANAAATPIVVSVDDATGVVNVISTT